MTSVQSLSAILGIAASKRFLALTTFFLKVSRTASTVTWQEQREEVNYIHSAIPQGTVKKVTRQCEELLIQPACLALVS